MRSRRYERYLRTPKWHTTRAAAIRRAGGKCQRCGAVEGLEVHHRTYARLGRERPEDLVVLCRRCHGGAHDAQRYERGLDTYGYKKYGEHWDEWPGYERVAEEFDAWLERQDQ